MDAGPVAFIAVVVLVIVALQLRKQRKRAAEVDLEDKSWLRAPELEPDPLSRHAPVKDFHVHGSEATVTFDVPLSDGDDEILNDLLVDEAVEVLREKRHSLPIDGVTEIVVFAGRGETREIGRTQLPSPGVLPPPAPVEIFNFSHVAKDPIASQFEGDSVLQVETKVSVPRDDLGPLRDELKVPKGLERGLRARGVDPDVVDGPTFVLGILELFDYKVTPVGEPGVYTATKGNTQTFIRTEIHGPGSHPELDEKLIRKFVVEFGTSGADRGLLITDKYGPFLVHEIESHEPRVRFITRERSQRFIDSMALG
jgi:hypothetical protein